ncbi:unnamed protein product, partial [Prorocentrum cordatum]
SAPELLRGARPRPRRSCVGRARRGHGAVRRGPRAGGRRGDRGGRGASGGQGAARGAAAAAGGPGPLPGVEVVRELHQRFRPGRQGIPGGRGPAEYSADRLRSALRRRTRPGVGADPRVRRQLPRLPIRKMLGTAVQVAQGLVPLAFLPAALDRRVRCATPRAPPDGLIFLRAEFEGTETGRAVQDALAAPEVQRGVGSWLDGLRRYIVGRDATARRWVEWLIDQVRYGADIQREARQAVSLHEALREADSRKARAARAAAVQLACLEAARGRPARAPGAAASGSRAAAE